MMSEQEQLDTYLLCLDAVALLEVCLYEKLLKFPYDKMAETLVKKHLIIRNKYNEQKEGEDETH